MKILSTFDGMACGMLAMMVAGVEVERYVAYEVDGYCCKTSTHNFPGIEHKGDVFNADFTEYKGFDFLVGGVAMYLLEHSADQEPRDSCIWNGMGTVQSVCQSVARSTA
ncbi:MAG: DNA cytosine methyltransferase [Prevotellaceae bacterium]|nr:DNA cytosine methyltransferase [Candidatus Faecinaster equi]